MTVAPPILAGAPGSFPHSVFHERHPVLIDQVIAGLPYGPPQRTALRHLLSESTGGVVEHLRTEAGDLSQWLAWGRDMWGRPWDEVPFLWAESYFYRRLLEAVGYFGPGVWHGVDPFAPKKTAELDDPAVAADLAALAELTGGPQDTTRDALLVSALWGNQADLGFQLTAGSGTRSSRLVVDDSADLWATLAAAGNPTVCVIADNAGRELLPDLVLIDHLLGTGQAGQVVLYLKPQPYYVSDATMPDLLATLRLLCAADVPQAQRIGQRLWQAIRTDRLVLRTHEFFCAPLSFHDMPADLTAELAAATMTVLKGDLNYRRLVGDRYWPPTRSFADLVDYFPSPVTALRTLKSDVIVGLTAAQVDELDSADEGWRRNGEHALIQCRVATG